MSVKSIGYTRGKDFGQKKYVVPNITINAVGQITDVSVSDTPSNVTIASDITELGQEINQDLARLGRETEKYNVLEEDYQTKKDAYDDLENKMTELTDNINALYASVTSQDAPILLYSFDSTQSWVNNYSNTVPQNLYTRPNNFFNNTTPYTYPIGESMTLQAGTYFLDVRLMLVNITGPLTIDGVNYDMPQPNGASTVIGEIRVTLNGEVYTTFVNNGVDYYMSQIYLNGSTIIDVSTADSVLEVSFWFTGNLPSNQDVDGKQIYSWQISSNPQATYPIELGFGNFNSAANGAPTLSLWELNFV
jgi:hypothetical protein